MKFSVKKAVKADARLRMALMGPAGSGKTYTMLRVGTALLDAGDRMAVIDTEHGSASKYADRFDFDTLPLETYEPTTYVEAIAYLTEQGYKVIGIDSLSHAWIGKGGALEQVERASQKSATGNSSGNSFNAWRNVTPQQNALVEAILGCKSHVIATMRVKTAYELQTNEKGKVQPVKIGLAPVQRDGFEYEFDVVGDMTRENDLVISKSRCPMLIETNDGTYKKPGEDVAGILRSWLKGEKVLSPQEIGALINGCSSLQELDAVREDPSVKKAKSVYGEGSDDWKLVTRTWMARRQALAATPEQKDPA